MNRIRLLTGVLLLVLLAVAVPVQTVAGQGGFDWAYLYDLPFSDYCANFIEGYWLEDFGFQSAPIDPDYLYTQRLSFNITIADRTIFPSRVEMDIGATFQNGDTISYTGSAHVYGAETSFEDESMPDSESFGVVMFPSGVGDGGNTINVTIQSNGDPGGFLVSNIRIFGDGDFPYVDVVYDNCAFIPTPTLTPSNTFTPAPPTNTPVPTSTFTPSNTPVPTSTPPGGYWECYWNFLEDDYSEVWGTVDEGGNPSAVWTDGVGWETAPVVADGYNYILLQATATSDSSTHFTHILFDVYTSGFIDGAVGWRIKDKWTGNPGYSGSVIGMGEWEGDRDLWAPGESGVMALGFEGNSPRFTEVDEDWIIFSALVEGYGPNTLCDGQPTRTPTPTRTRTNTRTPDPSGTATTTPLPLPSGTGTTTPFPTHTRLPVTGVPTFTRPPDATFPPTTTPYPTVTAFPHTPAATSTGTPAVTSTPIFIPFPTMTGGGEGPLTGFGEMTGSLLNFIGNVYRQGRGYLTETVNRANGVITAYQVAVPVAIPGLPDCQANRLESELCAIYWFLEMTLFQPPIGNLIVPVAVIAVDLLIVFTFVKMGKAVLARLLEVIKS